MCELYIYNISLNIIIFSHTIFFLLLKLKHNLFTDIFQRRLQQRLNSIHEDDNYTSTIIANEDDTNVTLVLSPFYYYHFNVLFCD